MAVSTQPPGDIATQPPGDSATQPPGDSATQPPGDSATQPPHLAFELTGALPRGQTVVLEASAGTGKTFTIASLAARYVAEGTSLQRILLITFTRAATGELRERVRERLAQVARALDHMLRAGLAGEALRGSSPARDPLLQLLADGPAAQIETRRRRLESALADFDAATITTTHGFCQEALAGLGLAGDLEADTTFAEDLGDLTEEALRDLWVRRFHDCERPPITYAQAQRIARAALANPDAPIVPAQGEPAAMRVRLARAVRQEVEARKRRRGLITYDDLLTRLHAALQGPDGELAAARLRARYEVVLIDEFQDTDPLQWEIVRRAFGEAHRTLILIADPKQAIYAFRGADVYAYLEAAASASVKRTLAVNWRSDEGLLRAYDALFGAATPRAEPAGGAGTQTETPAGAATLGEEGIVYRRVDAAPDHRAARLHGARCAAALRIRLLAREHVTQTRHGYASANAAREHIARDLAGEVAALLASGARIEKKARQDSVRRQLHPGDLAVLVQTHRHAEQVRRALGQAGIPAVINGAASVFATDAARHWLALLEALERPADSGPARAAALTPFLAWPASTLAGADEAALGELHARLREWAAVLRGQGVAALLETIARGERLTARLLSLPDGERALTDLRHIGQLLQAAAGEEQLAGAALIAWLRRRIHEADRDRALEERSRRLESDARAVQVLTIHRSKGLEFPVVYVPFLWEPSHIPEAGKLEEAEPVCFHDRDAGYRRTLDVSLEGPDYRRHHERYVVEQRGEDLRLAYVALTRARHQAVLWWAGSWNSRHSALGRLVFSRAHDGRVPARGTHTPSDTEARKRFEQIAALAPGQISVEAAVSAPAVEWRAPLEAPAQLTLASFERELDGRWRRTSFTDLARPAEPSVAGVRAAVTSEPDQPAVVDEPPEEPAATVPGGSLALAALPAGRRAGTLVHQVLSACDFAAADLDAELGGALAVASARRSVQIADVAAVVSGLKAAIETPLCAPLEGLRLRDLARADRLDELAFELPLAGGEHPVGALSLPAVADLLAAHVPAEDPAHGYAERLRDPALRREARGYLTGSLDLVVRVHAAEGPRFALIDYKTNWLSPPDSDPQPSHYAPAALREEMHRHHYLLQALLYTVALHRYLRWRLADYEPERHLAGVLYLFLRGMAGPRTPLVDGARCGVFAWRAPIPLVRALSEELERGGGR
jgi:exodeoxyribonuclease V beta subunit